MEQWLIDLSLFGYCDVGAAGETIPFHHWEARLRRDTPGLILDEEVLPRYFKTGSSPAEAVLDLHRQVYHDVMMFNRGILQAMEENG